MKYSHLIYTGLLCTCIHFLIIGCVEDDSIKSQDLFNIEPIRYKSIEFDSIQLDTLRLADLTESSYVGFVHTQENEIRFVDTERGWIFVFDSEGRFLKRLMGQGHGPQEIPMAGIQFYSPLPDGGHLYIGSSNDYYVFNSDDERIYDGIIRWQGDIPVEVLNRNPDPEQQRSYNLAYEIGDMRVNPSGTHAYLPLTVSSPAFSDFNFTTDLFAEEARMLGKMHIETGEIENIIGRYSPIYASNENVRHFPFFKNDIVNDQIAVTYMPDSLIYLFDLDFQTMQGAFGYSGLQMDVNYRPLPSNPDNIVLRQHWMEEIHNRGYYTSLTYIEERDLLFRGYRRGGDSLTDGLQVYRGNTLIADVNVPKINTGHFPVYIKVSGYISPWFYTNAIIDEMAESVIVYRFQIDE